jgi:antitoxin MazE
MPKRPVANLKIRKWGNSLAVRIPANVARSARLSEGQPVEMSVEDDRVAITPVGTPRLTLAQKLARFDPKKHRGELMVTGRAGAEGF